MQKRRPRLLKLKGLPLNKLRKKRPKESLLRRLKPLVSPLKKQKPKNWLMRRLKQRGKPPKKNPKTLKSQ